MQREDMNRLIEQHLTAEKAGNPAGCVVMYTDDVIHDVVGSPACPLHGPDAARGFYEMLMQNIKTEQMDVRHAWYGPDFCVMAWNSYSYGQGQSTGPTGTRRALPAGRGLIQGSWSVLSHREITR